MSQAVVIWMLGGWFVVATIGSLMIEGVMSPGADTETADATGVSPQSVRSADQEARPRVAA